MPCCAWKCVFTTVFGDVDTQDRFSVRINEDHKNYFTDWCFMNLQPTFLMPQVFIRALF